MKIRIFALVLCIVPYYMATANGAETSRVGVGRLTMSTGPGISAKNIVTSKNDSEPVNNVVTNVPNNTSSTVVVVSNEPVVMGSQNCRAAYRACMDDFCLLSDGEGERCACSSNINKSKSLIKEIQQIQAEADNLYTEGVEREQLGAKAKLVFGESDAAKRSSRVSGLSFSLTAFLKIEHTRA